MNKADQYLIYRRRGIFTKLLKYLETKGLMYEVPLSETLEAWDTWHITTKKRYPVQYFIRESIEDLERHYLRYYHRIFYYLKTSFFPENDIIRKAIPVRGYSFTSLIMKMNFAAILQYKKETDTTDYELYADESYKEFKKWLDSSAVWITEGRDNLEKKVIESYPDFSLFKADADASRIEDAYKEIERLENLIRQTDENILVQMMKYREYF